MSKDKYIGFDAKSKFKEICKELKSLCWEFPTCEGCPCKKDHIGCSLKGKSPRDINID